MADANRISRRVRTYCRKSLKHMCAAPLLLMVAYSQASSVSAAVITHLETYSNAADGFNLPYALVIPTAANQVLLTNCGFSNSGALVSLSINVDALSNNFGQLAPKQVLKDGVAGVSNLSGAGNIALSPDEKYVYVVSALDAAVVWFSRDESTGQLSFKNFLKNNEGSVTGLAGARDILVSKDGKHVYVTGHDSNSIVIFSRDSTTGGLTFVGAMHDDSALDGATNMLLIDDLHLYVTNSVGDSISVFARNSVTGELSLLANYHNLENEVEGLTQATGIAATSEGEMIYITGVADNSLVSFKRDTRATLSNPGEAPVANPAYGKLAFLNVLRNGDVLNGETISGFAGASVVRVSDDNSHVYVAAISGSALSLFRRNPLTGELMQTEVHAHMSGYEDGLQGIADFRLQKDTGLLITTSPISDQLGIYQVGSTDLSIKLTQDITPTSNTLKTVFANEVFNMVYHVSSDKAAHHVAVTQKYTDAFEFVSSSLSAQSCLASDTAVSCELGDLPAQESRDLHFSFRAKYAGENEIIAAIFSDEQDSAPGDNKVSSNVLVSSVLSPKSSAVAAKESTSEVKSGAMAWWALLMLLIPVMRKVNRNE